VLGAAAVARTLLVADPRETAARAALTAPATPERSREDVITKALRPLIAANARLTGALRALSGSPPATEALQLVEEARAATAKATYARMPAYASVALLLAAERRFLLRLAVHLQEPTAYRLARVRWAAKTLRRAFARAGQPKGSASVLGLTELIAWSEAHEWRPPTAAGPARPRIAPPSPAPPPRAFIAPPATPTPGPTAEALAPASTAEALAPGPSTPTPAP
jgi:hypothetical protein